MSLRLGAQLVAAKEESVATSSLEVQLLRHGLTLACRGGSHLGCHAGPHCQEKANVKHADTIGAQLVTYRGITMIYVEKAILKS